MERINNQPKERNSVIENKSRRKAVKTIVGGLTAIAAYNLLPSKWGTPVIEQVFLPAHAATSGDSCPTSISCVIIDNGVTPVPGSPNAAGNWALSLTGTITPPRAGVLIRVIRTYYETGLPPQTYDITSIPFFGDFTTDANGVYIINDIKDMTRLIRMQYDVSVDGCPNVTNSVSLDAP